MKNGKIKNWNRNEDETFTNTQDPFLQSLAVELQKEDKEVLLRVNEPYFVYLGYTFVGVFIQPRMMGVPWQCRDGVEGLRGGGGGSG